MKTFELLAGIYLSLWFLFFLWTYAVNVKEINQHSILLVAALFGATAQACVVMVPIGAIVLIWEGLK